MSAIGQIGFSVSTDPNFHAELNDKIMTALEAVGLQAEAYAVLELENSPRRVDTGLLRNSITHAVSGKPPDKTSYQASYGSNINQKTGKRYSAKSKKAGEVKSGTYQGYAPADDSDHLSVYIGTNVSYAPYVHFGTMHMDANPFLKHAVEKHRDEYKRIFEHYLK